ncbi:MAG: nicotinamide-nucleotide amidohydrolase family protein [Alphaproteobacteria bacterium]|nr:nicotinamide-nucleotide amidohydrolase family protein [Alphaproteobacteria bacterium]
MNNKKFGLGRGLEALLGEEDADFGLDKSKDYFIENTVFKNENSNEIDIEAIVPCRFQPRTEFNAEALETLASSIKEKVVHVKNETIEKYGVVSSQVAEEMAKNGRELLDVDICLSVTGNAGPTCEPGGKPVGCFYVGCATKDSVLVEEYNVSGSRSEIRETAVTKMKNIVTEVKI